MTLILTSPISENSASAVSAPRSAFSSGVSSGTGSYRSANASSCLSSTTVRRIRIARHSPRIESELGRACPQARLSVLTCSAGVGRRTKSNYTWVETETSLIKEPMTQLSSFGLKSAHSARNIRCDTRVFNGTAVRHIVNTARPGKVWHDLSSAQSTVAILLDQVSGMCETRFHVNQSLSRDRYGRDRWVRWWHGVFWSLSRA